MPEEMKITPERIEAINAKLQTIALECCRAINTQAGAEFVVLRGRLPQKGFPRGKCIGSDSKGKFYAYDAKNLLAKLVSMGVIELEWEEPWPPKPRKP